MSKIIELKIKNPKQIYQELVVALCPYKNRPVGSMFL